MNSAEFAKTLVQAYESNRGIFSNKINAEELVPATATPLQKALYLFYVIQLDYATRSQNLYAGARQLFNDNSKFFTPDYILNLADSRLAKTLSMYLHPRYINEAVTRYKFNSNVLLLNYYSDPQNIFLQASTAKEALESLKEFRGFGPKIGNFFVRTMINVFGYKFPDIDDMLPPVDIHDVRIAYLLGFTDSEEMTLSNINKVKELYNKACKDAKVSWLTFDKALWLLGSEGKPRSKEDIIQLLS